MQLATLLGYEAPVRSGEVNVTWGNSRVQGVHGVIHSVKQGWKLEDKKRWTYNSRRHRRHVADLYEGCLSALKQHTTPALWRRMEGWSWACSY